MTRRWKLHTNTLHIKFSLGRPHDGSILQSMYFRSQLMFSKITAQLNTSHPHLTCYQSSKIAAERFLLAFVFAKNPVLHQPAILKPARSFVTFIYRIKTSSTCRFCRYPELYEWYAACSVVFDLSGDAPTKNARFRRLTEQRGYCTLSQSQSWADCYPSVQQLCATLNFSCYVGFFIGIYEMSADSLELKRKPWMWATSRWPQAGIVVLWIMCRRLY